MRNNIFFIFSLVTCGPILKPNSMIEKLRQTPLHLKYLFLINSVGIMLLVWAFLQFIDFQDKYIFYLFMLLGVLSQVAVTTATLKSKTSVTYNISPAISLATVPFYGPAAAVLVEAITMLSLWLIKPADDINWKRSLPQLGFNTAMSTISIFSGGYVYLFMIDRLGMGIWFGTIISWLLAAIVTDQFNLLLLTVMLRLQYGKEFRIFTIWKENAWAIPIGILITSVGGGFLAFSFQQLGWIGVSVFFLPLVLSAYAFRLYVSQMQSHMDNLEDIVAERTEALQKLMQEKDAFLAVLSHDMKSPITTTHLYASMIKEHPYILEKKPHVIDSVLRSQETLLDIVNNILDLEMLKDHGQVPIEKETFDFVFAAQKVIEMIQIQAEAKSIELHKLGFETHIFVYADQRHMERVLSNLLTNAVKYTPSNGTITITLEPRKDELCIQISDSGYGIPPEELPYVFDRFRRVSSHQKLAAGTGLGLAITKALVEAHGGYVEVTSQKEEGSTFTTHLPILQKKPPNKNNQTELKKQHSQQSRREPQNKGVTTFISY